MTQEALKLALEALETLMIERRSIYDKAITAIKEALAQEQEPVAWMFQHDETGRMNYVSNDGIHNPTTFIEMNPRYALVCPLYTAPPAAQPEPGQMPNDMAQQMADARHLERFKPRLKK